MRRGDFLYQFEKKRLIVIIYFGCFLETLQNSPEITRIFIDYFY